MLVWRGSSSSTHRLAQSRREHYRTSLVDAPTTSGKHHPSTLAAPTALFGVATRCHQLSLAQCWRAAGISGDLRHTCQRGSEPVSAGCGGACPRARCLSLPLPRAREAPTPGCSAVAADCSGGCSRAAGAGDGAGQAGKLGQASSQLTAGRRAASDR